MRFEERTFFLVAADFLLDMMLATHCCCDHSSSFSGGNGRSNKLGYHVLKTLRSIIHVAEKTAELVQGGVGVGRVVLVPAFKDEAAETFL